MTPDEKFSICAKNIAKYNGKFEQILRINKQLRRNLLDSCIALHKNINDEKARDVFKNNSSREENFLNLIDENRNEVEDALKLAKKKVSATDTAVYEEMLYSLIDVCRFAKKTMPHMWKRVDQGKKVIKSNFEKSRLRKYIDLLQKESEINKEFAHRLEGSLKRLKPLLETYGKSIGAGFLGAILPAKFGFILFRDRSPEQLMNISTFSEYMEILAQNAHWEAVIVLAAYGFVAGVGCYLTDAFGFEKDKKPTYKEFQELATNEN